MELKYHSIALFCHLLHRDQHKDSEVVEIAFSTSSLNFNFIFRTLFCPHQFDDFGV
jgi:hypothetical protein